MKDTMNQSNKQKDKIKAAINSFDYDTQSNFNSSTG